jgi:hypothetical protein
VTTIPIILSLSREEKKSENPVHSNTSGGNNTATGYQALFSNTIANGNTATGFQALFNNTTGEFNTANGTTALISNTTGGANTAIITPARDRRSSTGNSAQFIETSNPEESRETCKHLKLWRSLSCSNCTQAFRFDSLSLASPLALYSCESLRPRVLPRNRSEIGMANPLLAIRSFLPHA